MDEQFEGKTIILADNNRASLKNWAAVLRATGYRVREANSFSAAERLLAQREGDLAVLDLRLKDDEDESDLSGLELAESHGVAVPTIILTAEVSKQAEAAVKAQRRKGRASTSIVEKSRGPVALLRVIRKKFVPRIFLVHGLDKKAKLAVMDFLEKGEFSVVVLQNLPGGTKSIIEKFEQYTDVHCAVVLMTPDDLGCKRSEPKNLRPRARQNVVFELGYLMAKLGRNRIVVLHKHKRGEIEFPSDYHGIQWLEMDSDGKWRHSLAQELENALARA